jgi:DNA-binding LytR/AlgR family response regulator
VFKNAYENLTIYKYIIWFTLTILAGYFLSFCFHCLLYKNAFLIANFLVFIKQYFVLVFPIILLSILLDYISSLKNKIFDIEKTNQFISSKNSNSSIVKKKYNFSSESKKENLELNEDCILFVNGADNYVEIHFINELNEYQTKLIRSKIKTIENDLNNNFLIKIHRSYLCNLKNVSQVSKKGQNYYLHFNTISVKIPVSLNSIENILHLLESNQ